MISSAHHTNKSGEVGKLPCSKKCLQFWTYIVNYKHSTCTQQSSYRITQLISKTHRAHTGILSKSKTGNCVLCFASCLKRVRKVHTANFGLSW